MHILDDVPSMYPPRECIFEVMHRIKPDDIRVCIVGQNPYPDDNAGGIPFISAMNRNTKFLESIRKELVREYPYLNIPGNINGLVDSWVNQGVFMVNMSMTMGDGKDPFTNDHSIMWEEFIRELMTWITHRRRVPVILMGSVAWTLEVPSGDLVIRVPHPVTRDGSFVGCDVFYRCNSVLDEPILWVVEV